MVMSKKNLSEVKSVEDMMKLMTDKQRKYCDLECVKEALDLVMHDVYLAAKMIAMRVNLLTGSGNTGMSNLVHSANYLLHTSDEFSNSEEYGYALWCVKYAEKGIRSDLKGAMVKNDEFDFIIDRYNSYVEIVGAEVVEQTFENYSTLYVQLKDQLIAADYKKRRATKMTKLILALLSTKFDFYKEYDKVDYYIKNYALQLTQFLTQQ